MELKRGKEEDEMTGGGNEDDKGHLCTFTDQQTATQMSHDVENEPYRTITKSSIAWLLL